MRYNHHWDTEGKRNTLYGRRWRTARGAFISANPLCSMCHAEGKLTAATVVDHIVPHKGDTALFWDEANWQSLCGWHHNSHKAKLEIRGYALDLGADGWPADPEHPANKGSDPVSGKSRPEELLPITVEVMLVCGAPGSGKTTWCHEQLVAGDTLIDFDEIDAAINGRARRPGRLIVPILRERNTRLLQAASQVSGRVFLTMMAARSIERDWWKRKLGRVTVVMMHTPLDECIKRMMADPSRSATLDEQIEVARRWWQRADADEAVDLSVSPGEGASNHEDCFPGHPRPPIDKYLVSQDEPINNIDDLGFA